MVRLSVSNMAQMRVRICGGEGEDLGELTFELGSDVEPGRAREDERSTGEPWRWRAVERVQIMARDRAAAGRLEHEDLGDVVQRGWWMLMRAHWPAVASSAPEQE